MSNTNEYAASAVFNGIIELIINQAVERVLESLKASEHSCASLGIIEIKFPDPYPDTYSGSLKDHLAALYSRAKRREDTIKELAENIENLRSFVLLKEEEFRHAVHQLQEQPNTADLEERVSELEKTVEPLDSYDASDLFQRIENMTENDAVGEIMGVLRSFATEIDKRL